MVLLTGSLKIENGNFDSIKNHSRVHGFTTFLRGETTPPSCSQPWPLPLVEMTLEVWVSVAPFVGSLARNADFRWFLGNRRRWNNLQISQDSYDDSIQFLMVMSEISTRFHLLYTNHVVFFWRVIILILSRLTFWESLYEEPASSLNQTAFTCR